MFSRNLVPERFLRLCCDTAGGYYTIEQKVRKLRLVVLNTNLCSDIVANEEDPAGQWTWLEDTLQKSQRNRETVNWIKVQNNVLSKN
jgi:hypothetical protein